MRYALKKGNGETVHVMIKSRQKPPQTDETLHELHLANHFLAAIIAG